MRHGNAHHFIVNSAINKRTLFFQKKVKLVWIESVHLKNVPISMLSILSVGTINSLHNLYSSDLHQNCIVNVNKIITATAETRALKLVKLSSTPYKYNHYDTNSTSISSKT